MSKQTAVEFFVEQLIIDELIDVIDGHQFLHLQSIAKEMEKEQIVDAFGEGNKYNGWALKHEPEEYYNKTFKQQQ
jgi:hypothetical protein